MVVKVQAGSLWKPIRTAVSELLILVGFAGVLVWAWGMLETTLYQHVQKNRFQRELREFPRPAAPHVTPPVARREPAASGAVRSATPGWFGRDPLVLGLLEVPRLEMSVVIREGMDDATLRKAAGHVPSTARPGESGNVVVLGHRDTLFRPLRGLEKGDRVRVRTMQGDFGYRVDSIEIVSQENVAFPEGNEARLTLVTCFPFDFVGPAPRRFVARGHLVEGGDPALPREAAR